MAEFEEKLNAILGNPEAMGQIVNIAKALTAGGSESTPSTSPPSDPIEADYVPVEGGDTASEPTADFSPLSMLGDLDPRLIQTAMLLFSEYSSTDDKKIALLAALKPFLKEERYAKVDKAVQIAKLSRVIRVAFQMFKGGGDSSGDV